MFNQSFDKVNDLLSQARNVAIVVPKNPDLDTMAAALSLSLSLEKSDKKTTVFSETAATVGLGNLVGIDGVKQFSTQNGVNGNGFIISLPYEQGAIEKISYDIVGDRINLTVVPGATGLNFTTEDISYQTPTQSYDFIVTIGVPIEPILPFDADGILPLLNIDYKADNTAYGTLALIEESYGSYSEMIATLLKELQLPTDADIAQNLLTGLVEATNNFQNAQTSPVAFETASFLMQKGAQRQRKVANEQQQVQEVRQNLQKQSFPTKQDRQNGRPQQPFDSAQGKQGPKPVVQQLTKGADAAKQPPKDWFEPKIYRGSTPMS